MTIFASGSAKSRPNRHCWFGTWHRLARWRRCSWRSGDDQEAAGQVGSTGHPVGATGPHGNVLKVRPPLVWNTGYVDEFITGLVRVLIGPCQRIGQNAVSQ
ncbi:hypothetical protein [Kibdelosporangium philippinense]|uniref:hypothetical protein n=1 Tax=Kibdelosporangium philippinense TaxID=211113 RepID=UPI00361DE34E